MFQKVTTKIEENLHEIYVGHLEPGNRDVIAAGPMIRPVGMQPHRAVLRWDGRKYIVHDEIFDLDADELKPQREFHDGDYCGDNLEMAFDQFIKRIERHRSRLGIVEE